MFHNGSSSSSMPVRSPSVASTLSRDSWTGTSGRREGNDDLRARNRAPPLCHIVDDPDTGEQRWRGRRTSRGRDGSWSRATGRDAALTMECKQARLDGGARPAHAARTSGRVLEDVDSSPEVYDLTVRARHRLPARPFAGNASANVTLRPRRELRDATPSAEFAVASRAPGRLVVGRPRSRTRGSWRRTRRSASRRARTRRAAWIVRMRARHLTPPIVRRVLHVRALVSSSETNSIEWIVRIGARDDGSPPSRRRSCATARSTCSSTPW